MQGSQRQKATLPRPCIAQVMSQQKGTSPSQLKYYNKKNLNVLHKEN